MNKFYVSGGRTRTTVFRKLEEWQSFERALLIELDPAKNESQACVEYVSPPEAAADVLPSILFKSATVQGNRLFTCTSTEVLVYELPSFRVKHDYISLPCFNDLHHVYPTQRGTLLVVVTGLDMVVEDHPRGNCASGVERGGRRHLEPILAGDGLSQGSDDQAASFASQPHV